MNNIKYYICLNIFLCILYKCVHCQDNIVTQGKPTQNFEQVQDFQPKEPQQIVSTDTPDPMALNQHPQNDVMDAQNTLEGNVIRENPVEKLNELSRDISNEINRNPYYKIPELTRKIREIAILHPELMEKLGVYVIPVIDEKEESEEKRNETNDLVTEDTEEGQKEGDMRSEVDKLIDKTEMIQAMTPEEKLEYIPQLKETIVYQILKNREILKELASQMGYQTEEYSEHPEEQENQQYENYDYQQGYQYYPNYGYYPGYGYYQGYENYPNYGYYNNYGNGQYYQNYPYYGY